MELSIIQAKLQELGIDGWLFYDHHLRDHIAYAILELDTSKMTSRRWLYYIPATGEPTKIVHRIEPRRLDTLPGKTVPYSGWAELHTAIRAAIAGAKSVAMQFSPENNVPQVSLVDGGTIDLIRSFDVEVISSANLVQIFLACLDEAQIDSHRKAAEIVQRIKDEAFALVFDSLKTGAYKTEYDIMQYILRRFDEENLTPGEHLPMVGVNEHAADPHFEVATEGSSFIKPGDALMIDLWAKFKTPRSIFYDITWCAFLGDTPPAEYEKMFNIAVQARKKAKQLLIDRFQSGTPVYGYEVDDAARTYIVEAGYGKFFVHRTGHSIGTEVHGIGVNIDNLETKDDRPIVPGVCFSLEPGLYKPPFGVRTEINIVIDYAGNVCSFGEEQEQLLLPPQ